MKNTMKFALTALLLAAAPFASAENPGSVQVSQAVKTAVTADSSKVLEIVANKVAADKSCACEIVKAAILASDADQALVAKIVTTAILEAPSETRVITQCAIATAPDAISEIQAVVERFDAAGGEGYSAKGGFDDSKGVLDDGKGMPTPPPTDGPNPLDYPFQSLDDPIVKDSRYLPEFFFPPIEDDPNVTLPMMVEGDTSSNRPNGFEGGFDNSIE